MPSNKPRLVIRTTQEILDEFDRICKREDRSMSNLGERIIKQYIEEYKQQESRTERKNEMEKSSISKTG